MVPSARITGIGEVLATSKLAGVSLETMIFEAARSALDDAGLERGDLDGVVLSASDQTDGRAISSMLTSGPAGAYLNEEINLASSPGHALVMGALQIMSGTHERVLVASWGKASESAGGTTEPAERLSAEPFYDRDAGLSSLAATGLQAQAHRQGFERADRAAARVASRNHGHDENGSPRHDEDAILASALVAYPLRALELPPAIDGTFALILEASREGVVAAPVVAGMGWCSDSNRMDARDLVGLRHLERAAADAYERAGVSARDIEVFELHDYSPDAELLAYAPLGLCEPGTAVDAVLDGALADLRINPGGGSVAGEAPFGGSLRKVLNAVRAVSTGGSGRALAQVSTGFAGQFQSVFVVQGASA